MAANISNVGRKMFGRMMSTKSYDGVATVEKGVVGRLNVRNLTGAENFREASRRSSLFENFRGNGFAEEEIGIGFNRARESAGNEWNNMSTLRRKASVNDQIMRERAMQKLGADAAPSGRQLVGDYVDGLRNSGTIGNEDYVALRHRAENGRSATDLYDDLVGMEAKRQNRAHAVNQAQARRQDVTRVQEAVAESTQPAANTANVMQERSFKNARSQSDWTQTRIHNETVAIDRDMQRVLDIHNSGKMDDGLAKKLGFDGAADPRLAGDSGQQAIQDIYNAKRNNVKPHTTFGDKMGYNKVPQTAAAVGGTAWLVNQMSQSKGQMSNAQLYGQQQQRY